MMGFPDGLTGQDVAFFLFVEGLKVLEKSRRSLSIFREPQKSEEVAT
jgi:hypothetical protein